MKVVVHVKSADEIAAARTAAEASMQDGDELEIIVAQRVALPAERQPARPAGGAPGGQQA